MEEPVFICWDDCGRGEDDAVSVNAHDSEAAARQYGEAENAYSDFVAKRVVNVKAPDGKTREFTVEAEMTYVYSARENPGMFAGI